MHIRENMADIKKASKHIFQSNSLTLKDGEVLDIKKIEDIENFLATSFKDILNSIWKKWAKHMEDELQKTIDDIDNIPAKSLSQLDTGLHQAFTEARDTYIREIGQIRRKLRLSTAKLDVNTMKELRALVNISPPPEITTVMSLLKDLSSPHQAKQKRFDPAFRKGIQPLELVERTKVSLASLNVKQTEDNATLLNIASPINNNRDDKTDTNTKIENTLAVIRGNADMNFSTRSNSRGTSISNSSHDENSNGVDTPLTVLEDSIVLPEIAHFNLASSLNRRALVDRNNANNGVRNPPNTPTNIDSLEPHEVAENIHQSTPNQNTKILSQSIVMQGNTVEHHQDAEVTKPLIANVSKAKAIKKWQARFNLSQLYFPKRRSPLITAKDHISAEPIASETYIVKAGKNNSFTLASPKQFRYIVDGHKSHNKHLVGQTISFETDKIKLEGLDDVKEGKFYEISISANTTYFQSLPIELFRDECIIERSACQGDGLKQIGGKEIIRQDSDAIYVLLNAKQTRKHKVCEIRRDLIPDHFADTIHDLKELPDNFKCKGTKISRKLQKRSSRS